MNETDTSASGGVENGVDISDGGHAMRVNRRLRLSILSVMGLVALAAVLFGGVAAQRRERVTRERVAALTAELRLRQDRVDWAERMHRVGYRSKAELAADHKKLAEVESQLKMLGASPQGP
jgi:hypothetical protein